MYLNLKGGWRAALDAAVRHHNRSRYSTIGCSPSFALKGEAPYLPADAKFGLRGRVRLIERSFSAQEESYIRERQIVTEGRTVPTKVPDFALGESILVREGIGKQKKFIGPYTISSVESAYPREFLTLWGVREKLHPCGMSQNTVIIAVSACVLSCEFSSPIYCHSTCGTVFLTVGIRRVAVDAVNRRLSFVYPGLDENYGYGY